jgi:hypothetical protein
MYFLFACTDRREISSFERTLQLVDRKWTLVVVPDGFSLLGYLQEVHKGASYPEMIVLSKSIGRLGWPETLTLLKTDDLYRLIPTVLIASQLKKGEASLCRRLGTDLLAPPLEPEQWLQAIRRLCASCV